LQEDIQNRSIALSTQATKLTAKGLAQLMRAALRQMGKRGNSDKVGETTFKELSKNGALEDLEISDANIKAFDPFARKYGVKYALQRDSSETPPKWIVYFNSKDVKSMTAAFKAFSDKMITKEKEKPSTRDTMQKLQERIKNVVRDKTRHKHRGEHEL
jgi:hypothetical protein